MGQAQRAVIALLVCLAMWLMWQSYSSQNPGQAAQQPSAQSTAAKSPDSPKPHDNGAWEWITKDAAGFFTLCLVIVGGGQFVLFWVQLNFMSRSIKDAELAANAAKASAETAKEQVEAAKAQIEITKIGIFDLERAYLAVGPTQIKTQYKITDTVRARGHTIGSDPKEIVVKLQIQNTGRTAATIKKIYGIFSDYTPIDGSPVYVPIGDQPVGTDLSIPAGESCVLDPFIFASDVVANQFFWGYIEYQDIFKNKRTSRFCVYLQIAPLNETGKFQIAGSDHWRECD